MKRLASLIVDRPRAVLLAALALFVLALILAASRLEMRTSRGALIGEHHPFRKNQVELEKEHGDQETIVLALAGPKPERLAAAADELDRALRARPELFRSIFSRITAEDFADSALLLAPLQSLEVLEKIGPALLGSDPEARLGSLLLAVDELAAEAMSDASSRSQSLEAVLPSLQALLQSAAALEDQSLSMRQWMSAEPGFEGYLWGEDRARLIVLLNPARAEGGLDPRQAAVRELRSLVEALKKNFPDLRVGLTGAPVLEVDEVETYTRDSTRASLLSFLGVTVLLIIALRRLLAPILIGLSLFVSLILTLAAASLWPGHLNLLSVVFVVVIIGLGVDFGLHVLARYDETAKSQPKDLSSTELARIALTEAFEGTGRATIAGAVTTSLAFYSALFTDFRGLAELGIIAGSGVLCALLVMLTVLPASIVLADRWRRLDASPGPQPWAMSLDSLSARRPRVLVGLALLAFSFFGLAARNLRFDSNLLALQDPSLPSVQWELEILSDRELSGWFLVGSYPDIAALRTANARLASCPQVQRVESYAALCPPQQDELVLRWKRLGARLEAAATSASTSSGLGALKSGIEALTNRLEDAQERALSAGRESAVAALERLLSSLRSLAQTADRDPAALGAWQRRKLSELCSELVVLGARARRVEALSPERLPATLRDRLLGRSGRFLARIYPKANIWDQDAMNAFIDAALRIEPGLTGDPVVAREASRLMVRSYLESAAYALLLITIFLLLFFRSLVPTLLSLVGLALGATVFAGTMAIFGQSFNPGNMIALPLILGLGIDTSVHIVHRARDQGCDGLLSSSLGRAVLYSALTSIVGFGSLMISAHRGTASIGSAIAIGLCCCVASSLIALPALCRLILPEPGGGAGT